MKRLVISALVCVCLSGCVQNQAFWDKPGAEAGEFDREKYTCLQQSQQNASTAYVNRYGGVANSGVVTNDGLYSACMNARGWQLIRVTDVSAYTEAGKSIVLELQRACSEFEAAVADKTSCKAVEPTPKQIADRSKITQRERIALQKFRNAVGQAFNQIAELDRKYYVKGGDAVASVIESNTLRGDQLAAELMEGRITWGEYSRRRFENSKRDRESLRIANSG